MRIAFVLLCVSLISGCGISLRYNKLRVGHLDDKTVIDAAGEETVHESTCGVVIQWLPD